MRVSFQPVCVCHSNPGAQALAERIAGAESREAARVAEERKKRNYADFWCEDGQTASPHALRQLLPYEELASMTPQRPLATTNELPTLLQLRRAVQLLHDCLRCLEVVQPAPSPHQQPQGAHPRH